MKIDIYGKSNCTYCLAAIELCEIHELDFKYHLLDRDYSIMDLWKKVHFKTFPQIFMNGESIGGYSELRDFINGV